MKQGLVRLLYNFGKRFMGWTLHMIMYVLLCYPVSIPIYYQQGVLFLVYLLNLQFCVFAFYLVYSFRVLECIETYWETLCEESR